MNNYNNTRGEDGVSREAYRIQLQSHPVPVYMVVLEDDDPATTVTALDHWHAASKKTRNEMAILLKVKKSLTDSVKIDFWQQLLGQVEYQKWVASHGGNGWVPGDKVTEDKLQHMLNWRNTKLKEVGNRIKCFEALLKRQEEANKEKKMPNNKKDDNGGGFGPGKSTGMTV